jgi:capsule polysaccharide export protein KpsE/RkpR
MHHAENLLSGLYTKTSRFPVRCDGLQQYPRKLSIKKNSRFLLIVSALCIIYFLIWLTDVIVYFMEICLCTTQPIK